MGVGETTQVVFLGNLSPVLDTSPTDGLAFCVRPLQNGPKAIPPPKYLLRVFCPTPRALFFSQSGHSQVELQGGVIMTNLRALVGGCFLLAVTGIVVFVPLSWAVVLGIGEAYPEKIIKGRPDQRNAELEQKKLLPRATYELVAKQK